MLCHDPRISDDRNHKVETNNPALIAAEQLDGAPINWEVVIAMADWADLPEDEQERYRQLR